MNLAMNDKLKRMIELSSLTQKEIAAKLGTNQIHLNKVLNGKASLTTRMAKKLSTIPELCQLRASTTRGFETLRFAVFELLVRFDFSTALEFFFLSFANNLSCVEFSATGTLWTMLLFFELPPFVYTNERPYPSIKLRFENAELTFFAAVIFNFFFLHNYICI